MYWILPANGKIYDHASAFQKWGFIDWRQNHRKYQRGDIVYIYCTRPYKKIMYKTIVEKVGLRSDEIVNDLCFWTQEEEYYKALSGTFARLKLLEQVCTEKLSLAALQANGLTAAPQSAVKLQNPSLIAYIEKFMNDTYDDDIFPDSADTETCPEGAKTKIYVNKYERSSIAREKCIESHGCRCAVCGMDFEEKYGELGKGFIHIHHIVPLHEIDSEYRVDYKKDLVPVCPNCHAMLHRKLNGRCLSLEELKKVLK